MTKEFGGGAVGFHFGFLFDQSDWSDQTDRTDHKIKNSLMRVGAESVAWGFVIAKTEARGLVSCLTQHKT